MNVSQSAMVQWGREFKSERLDKSPKATPMTPEHKRKKAVKEHVDTLHDNLR